MNAKVIYYRTKKIHVLGRNIKPNDELLARDEGTAELNPIYRVNVLNDQGNESGEEYELMRCKWFGSTSSVYDPEQEHPKVWVETRAKIIGWTPDGKEVVIE